jgi:hypothetical protein
MHLKGSDSVKKPMPNDDCPVWTSGVWMASSATGSCPAPRARAAQKGDWRIGRPVPGDRSTR